MVSSLIEDWVGSTYLQIKNILFIHKKYKYKLSTKLERSLTINMAIITLKEACTKDYFATISYFAVLVQWTSNEGNIIRSSYWLDDLSLHFNDLWWRLFIWLPGQSVHTWYARMGNMQNFKWFKLINFS